MSQARVEIEGYVSQDAELRFTESGKALLNVSVPHNQRRKNQAGEWESVGDTLWVRFTLWDDDAHRYAELLVKGAHVVVSGIPEVRVWESGDKHGANLEVKFPRVSIVPSKDARNAPERPQEPAGDVWGAPEGGGFGDDLSTPF